MSTQIFVEVARRAAKEVTKEYVLRELATGAAIGAAFDGLTSFFTGKNPLKEGAKGAAAGAAGNGAAVVLRDIARQRSPIVLAGSMMASIGTRYVINIATGRVVLTAEQDDEKVIGG